MITIAIFASGRGSNAIQIIEHAHQVEIFTVGLIVSNKADAAILSYAESMSIPSIVLDKKSFYNSAYSVDILRQYSIDLVVLAGFLWLVPPSLVKAFPDRIINIHPALLPRFGGKGMYGSNIHNAVFAAGENRSGVTIHYVNEAYDEGKFIIQASTQIAQCISPEEIAQKVLKLEHYFFPRVVAALARNLNSQG